MVELFLCQLQSRSQTFTLTVAEAVFQLALMREVCVIYSQFDCVLSFIVERIRFISGFGFVGDVDAYKLRVVWLNLRLTSKFLSSIYSMSSMLKCFVVFWVLHCRSEYIRISWLYRIFSSSSQMMLQMSILCLFISKISS